MHPALSVVFFSTVSGAGYGLLFWLGLHVLCAPQAQTRNAVLLGLTLGFVLVSTGLVASLAHLGQPQRAWRAVSQWRSSWLSREGVAACFSFVPMLGLAIAVWSSAAVGLIRLLAFLLSVTALATVFCTARIYTSLPTIPAWRSRHVLPTFVLCAGLIGALLVGAVPGLSGTSSRLLSLVAVLMALALGGFKSSYWKLLDAGGAVANAASAVGLPTQRDVRAFEAPHTEANFITREMVFVLARRHARRLRRIVWLALMLIPTMLALAICLLAPADSTLWFVAAALSGMFGSLIERWLFFAEARHVVSVYYQ